MITNFKNNDVTIKSIAKLLKNTNPIDDDSYEFLMNELLVQVYTSYENFLKQLLTDLFMQAKSNYRYAPFLTDHKLWGVVERKNSKSYMVPDGKLDSIKSKFCILKNSYLIDELSIIDTLVLERNKFCHTGSHTATLEQILNAYVTIKYVCKYLDFCYTSNDDEVIAKIKKVQEFLNNFTAHSKGCLLSIKGDHIPNDMTAFDKHVNLYRELKDSNCFDIHQDTRELLEENKINFLINCKGMLKSDFIEALDRFHQAFYVKAFTFQNKENLTIEEFLEK